MTGTPLSSSTCSAATLAAGYPSRGVVVAVPGGHRGLVFPHRAAEVGPDRRLEWWPAASAYTALLEISTVEVA